MLLAESHKRLASLTKDPAQYKQLLKKLIVQGLWKLQEPTVILVCRKQDVALVKEVISSATDEYKHKSGKDCNVELDTQTFLPPGPEFATSEGEICSGGVVLSSNEGRIICSNTLDARLAMGYEQNLPKIRTTLFGKSLTRVHYD